MNRQEKFAVQVARSDKKTGKPIRKATNEHVQAIYNAAYAKARGPAKPETEPQS